MLLICLTIYSLTIKYIPSIHMIIPLQFIFVVYISFILLQFIFVVYICKVTHWFAYTQTRAFIHGRKKSISMSTSVRQNGHM